MNKFQSIIFKCKYVLRLRKKIKSLKRQINSGEHSKLEDLQAELAWCRDKLFQWTKA